MANSPKSSNKEKTSIMKKKKNLEKIFQSPQETITFKNINRKTKQGM